MQQPSGAGRRQTAVVTCPKSMVGRVIGRNGETIKALQTYTGALIQIDQTCDPTKIAISGTPQSLNLALSMVHDIVRGTFKGFALLRQATGHSSRGPHQLSSKPVYAPGYGLIPPSQLYGGETATAMLHPSGAGIMATPTAATAGPAYPQLLTTGPLPGAPPQFVLGVQPMPVPGAALHTPVYNVIGSPAFGGHVYLSPIDYTAGAPAAPGAPMGVGGVVTGSANPGEMVSYYSDGSSLLTGATGSRLFQTVGGVTRGSAGAGTLLGANGSGGTDASGMALGGPVAYGSSAVAGGSHGHGHGQGAGAAGGATAGGLLQPGSLVLDAEGSLYTYTVDG